MSAGKTLRSPADLADAGLVPPERLRALERVAARYAVAITPAMAELIDPADPHDPIARQFVPDAAELVTSPEERADPIGDEAHGPVEGIVHRYPDRVLLKPVHVCPVYCRFCFRREMVGPDGLGTLSPDELAAAIAYIAARPEIWEVIVTGGDPLILSPRRLRAISEGLAADRARQGRPLPHARAGRRPRAGDAGAGRGAEGRGQGDLSSSSTPTIPRELTPAARAACARIVDAGIPMLSQSVLLRGVNDDPETLARL